MHMHMHTLEWKAFLFFTVCGHTMHFAIKAKQQVEEEATHTARITNCICAAFASILFYFTFVFFFSELQNI